MIDDRKEQNIEINQKEIKRPDPIDKFGMLQSNGEEILSSDPPRIRYSAGILFPQGIIPDKSNDTDEKEIEEFVSDNENSISEAGDIETNNVGNGSSELLQDSEETLNLSNA